MLCRSHWIACRLTCRLLTAVFDGRVLPPPLAHGSPAGIARCIAPRRGINFRNPYYSPEHGQLLVPSERYAQMGNVWFIPSVPTLLNWLAKIGFKTRAVSMSIKQPATNNAQLIG